MISIQSPTRTFDACETVIIIPEKAVEEAGYIQMFSANDSGHAKHEYHALAQMAYFQLQDDELDIREADSPLIVLAAGERVELLGGMIVCRQGTGEVYILVQAGQNRKKLLEAAYRWCTRWVRLDI
ncbi:MAG: hypothetical protein A2X81_18530 [Desulfobacterales bacterium GWB2_56_26]|nr:MAG: hypothetical protein A2X81_18530 [Desulfobacterales bacterium GWB2_56_26]